MSLAIMLNKKENNKFIRCTEEQQHKTHVLTKIFPDTGEQPSDEKAPQSS